MGQLLPIFGQNSSRFGASTAYWVNCQGLKAWGLPLSWKASGRLVGPALGWLVVVWVVGDCPSCLSD